MPHPERQKPEAPARARATFRDVIAERGAILAIVALVGCEMKAPPPQGANVAPSGAGGSTPTVAAPAGAGARNPPLSQDDTATWIWTACGTIPSTLVSDSEGYPSDFMTRYHPGDAIMGGHPTTTDGSRDLWRITALAVSEDEGTLVSMGGVTLVWNLAPAFEDSRAVVIGGGIPERPRVEVSGDGRWIAISGDGWRVTSREGGLGPALSPPRDISCWPAEARFSPDGRWLVQAAFGPDLYVYRVEDLAAAVGDDLQPIATLAAPCGPARSDSAYGSTTRFAFTPDGARLITETGAQFSTADWGLVTPATHAPMAHGSSGSFEVTANGQNLVSDCQYVKDFGQVCAPDAARFPKFSPDGSWKVAGGTLTHLPTNVRQVLDPTALVAIFVPNGDVIAAGEDNSLTRYCKNR